MAETVRWLELAGDRRRRVARTVRKGRAVDDPRDAPYAVGFADASLAWLSWKRRFRPLHLMLVVLVLAELTLTGGWHPALVFYPLVGFTFLRVRAPRLRKRVLAARETNAELAERLKLPLVSLLMPGNALFRPGSRLRRRFMTALAVVLVGVVALAVAATVWAIGQKHRFASAADPICAREHSRLAALRAQALDPLGSQRRRVVIEQVSVQALQRIGARTRLQKSFLAWRRYEAELDVWLVGQLETGDRSGVSLGTERLNSARAYSRKLARRLGARACART